MMTSFAGYMTISDKDVVMDKKKNMIMARNWLTQNILTFAVKYV